MDAFVKAHLIDGPLDGQEVVLPPYRITYEVLRPGRPDATGIYLQDINEFGDPIAHDLDSVEFSFRGWM